MACPILVAAANDLPELPPGLPTRFSPRPGVIVDITRITNLAAELFVIRGGKRDVVWISNVWTEIGPPIDASRLAWTRAVNATTNEVLLHQVDWSQGMGFTGIPSRSLWPLWRWCSQATALQLQRGELDKALMVTANALRILHCSQGVPTTLSEIARQPFYGYEAPIWWLLQRDLNDAQLATLQDTLSQLDFTVAHLRAIELERAQMIQACETLLTDTAKARILFGYNGTVSLHLWRLAPSHYDLGWYLQTVQSQIEGLREAIEQRSFQHLFHRLGKTNSPPATHIFSKNFTWNVSSFHMLPFKAETRREIQMTAIALNRFRLKHARYPEKLNELVPDFCEDIPVAWMNGRSLLYERTSDFFRLWSVGEDGVDQGGDPLHPRKNNWWMNGVDFVWPTAATPEETRQYAEDRFAEWKAATTKP
ncbi:MAG: hypothetical protein ACPGVU_19765 [Limisphaerales bacterium]